MSEEAMMTVDRPGGPLAARVVIAGAGHAGGTVAALLRQYGHFGPITLVGDEQAAPYQRPPLSKDWLAGKTCTDALALRPIDFYAQNDIRFLPERKVVAVDRDAQSVQLSDGATMEFDYLVIATGSRPISLSIPGAELDGIFSLRSAVDADAIKAVIRTGCRLVLIGAGYIGLEVAASARALGAEVVVVEREGRILARVASEPVSRFMTRHHEANGVSFELGCSAVEFLGDAGHVTGVRLGDGRSIECDAVIVGVGAAPNVEVAQAAGLVCEGGIVVDLDGRSISDKRIFAIGDVAHRPMPIYDRMFTVESVPNALEQARQAASAIVGRPRPAGECPWQWSDQYNLKLQIAGYPFDVDDVVVRGNPDDDRFAVFHMRADCIQAVEAINAPPDFMMGRSLILSRRPICKSKLADTKIALKDITA